MSALKLRDAVADSLGRRRLSEAPPTQLAAWYAQHYGGPSADGVGEWLRALRGTQEGERQLVWADGRIVAVVTFARHARRCDGFYEAWGSVTPLPKPVTHAMLLENLRTRRRFDKRGIRALQGLPIRLDADTAAAITHMGGLGGTSIPFDDPDDEEPILWTGPHGLAPEASIEAALAEIRDLWSELGFPTAPRRQVRLGEAGRADLLAGDVVGEAKRVVTASCGPEQIERYLRYLHLVRGRPLGGLKGILLQCEDYTTDAVIKRLQASEFHLELWYVVDAGNGGWEFEQLA
jgi:hypothetical protein